MDLSALGFAPVDQGNAVAPTAPIDLSSLGFAPVGAPAGEDNFYADVFNEPEPLIPQGMLSGGVDELASTPIPMASEGMLQVAPPEPVQATAWWQRPLPPDASEREQLAYERINQLATELPPGKDPEAAYNQELVDFTHGSEADSRIVSFDPITKRTVYAGSYGDPVSRLLDSPVPRGLLNAADSVATTAADWALGTAGGITGDKGLSDMAEYAGRQRELNKSYDQSLNERQGEVGAMAAQVTEVMAKYTPIGAVGGMGALLPYIYAESTTDALNEGKRAGLGELDAQLYAHSIGAINAGFTAFGGAVGSKLGVKTFEEMVSSGLSPTLGRLGPPPNSFKALFRGLGRYAQSAGVETFAEEYPTYFAENAARYFSGLQDKVVPDTMWQDLGRIGAASAIMAIPGGLESVQEGPLTAQMMADMGIPPAVAKSQIDRDKISEIILNQLDEIQQQQQQPPTAPETLPEETEADQAPVEPPPVETPPEAPQEPTEDVVPPAEDGVPYVPAPNTPEYQVPPEGQGDPNPPDFEAPPEVTPQEEAPRKPPTPGSLEWRNERNLREGLGKPPEDAKGWIEDAIRRNGAQEQTPEAIAAWIEKGFSNENFWKYLDSTGQTLPEAVSSLMGQKKPRGPLAQQVDARRQGVPAPESQQDQVPADEVAQEPVETPPAEPVVTPEPAPAKPPAKAPKKKLAEAEKNRQIQIETQAEVDRTRSARLRNTARSIRSNLLKEGREKPAATSVEADVVLDATDLGEGTDKDKRFKFQPGYKRVKQIAAAAPEFAYDPVFTVNAKKQLVYKDGVTYTLDPALFNLHPSELKEGQTVGINLEDIGLKRLTAGEAVAQGLKNDGFKNARRKPSGAITVTWGNTPITISGEGESWTATPNGTSEGSQKAVKQANQTLKKMHFLAGEQAPSTEPGRAPAVSPPTAESAPGPVEDSEEVQGSSYESWAEPAEDDVLDDRDYAAARGDHVGEWEETAEGTRLRRRVLANPAFRRWAGTENVYTTAYPMHPLGTEDRYDEDGEVANKEQPGDRFNTGEPVVVRAFHGSPGSDIQAFDPKRLGENTGAGSAKLGFFFAGSQDTASEYAGESNPGVYVQNASSGYIYGHGATLKEAIEDTAQYQAMEPSTVEARIKSGIYSTQGFDADERGGRGIIPAFVRMRNPYVYDYKGVEYREKSYRDVIQQAKEAGHDGVILMNTKDPGPGSDHIFVVFDRKSIKSAIGNTGEYKEVRNILAGKEGGTLADEIDQQAKEAGYTGEEEAPRKIRSSDKVDLESIPEDLSVEIEAVRAKTGEKVKVTKPAREVISRLRSDISAYKKLIHCLGK